MTLRARLAVAFALVVILPVVLAIVVIGREVPQTLRQQADRTLQTGRSGATAMLQEACSDARLTAELLGREAVSSSPGAAVDDVVARHLADYAVIAGPDGSVRASAGALPGTAGAVPPARLDSCGADASPSGGGLGVVADRVDLRGRNGAGLGAAAVAFRLDTAVLDRLRAVSPAGATLVRDGTVVASTLPAPTAARIAAAVHGHPAGATLTVDDRRVGTVATVPGGPVLVVSAALQSVGDLELLLALVSLAALLLAILLAWQLSGLITRPLAQLSDAAVRVATGDLDARIDVDPRSRDEVGRLGTAFNEMTAELRTSMDALRTSRDELRNNLSRLGATLTHTHDLTGILTVVLETAMAVTNASAGAVLISSGDELTHKVSRGLDAWAATNPRIAWGAGVAGAVAATGEALAGRFAVDLQPAPGEPPAGSVISVPLPGRNRPFGVLNLYDRSDADTFDAADLDTIRGFAGQAGVAIDNLLLHQEAQRLSLTDGLTGLWNYRYFTMSLNREVERAARFVRPLALVMLDLDHFKAVNDVHGHQRGDAVLVELAARLRREVREVDVLARYGGEEFVLLLPETDVSGAAQAAERLREVVRGTPFGGETEQPLPVTVSLGVAVFPQHAANAVTLVRAADEALYAAKAGGRDGWRVAADAPAARRGAR